MIIIAGDSWACGEWKNGHLTHGGIGQYFYDAGYQVCNLGLGGGQNSITVSKIRSFLQSNPYHVDKISHIFVFQTEWTREPLEQLTSFDDLSYDYQAIKNRIISNFYHNLSKLGKNFNKNIYIIGGCSDTVWSDKFSQEYPNTLIACQSLTNLIVSQNHRTNNPVYSLFSELPYNKNFLNAFKKMFINKDFDILLGDIGLVDNRMLTWETSKEFFYPDGFHPNRKSHKILFDFLCKNFIL